MDKMIRDHVEPVVTIIKPLYTHIIFYCNETQNNNPDVVILNDRITGVALEVKNWAVYPHFNMTKTKKIIKKLKNVMINLTDGRNNNRKKKAVELRKIRVQFRLRNNRPDEIRKRGV